MAIDEKKRENLLADATAYNRRMLVSISGLTFGDQGLEHLFAGVRSDGRWSLYFDESPVIQLDSQGRLRRLFILPHKFAADQGRLVQLDRPCRGGRVEFARQPIGKNQEELLFAKLRDLFERTRKQLTSSSDVGPKVAIGNYPNDDVMWFDDLVALLEKLEKSIEVAPSM